MYNKYSNSGNLCRRDGGNMSKDQLLDPVYDSEVFNKDGTVNMQLLMEPKKRQVRRILGKRCALCHMRFGSRVSYDGRETVVQRSQSKRWTGKLICKGCAAYVRQLPNLTGFDAAREYVQKRLSYVHVRVLMARETNQGECRCGCGKTFLDPFNKRLYYSDACRSRHNRAQGRKDALGYTDKEYRNLTDTLKVEKMKRNLGGSV
jgi:hypothetical protein